MKKRRWGCLGILAVLVLNSTVSVKAEQTWPAGPEITGDFAVVMEANTGTVLYEKNAGQQLYPASITKVMTGLLAAERSSMDELVVFSADSVYKTEGSGIWRDVGEVMYMEQTLYAMMLNSANECAYAIAEHVGGSYDTFVQMMNQRAAELGCTGTHFSNPHGLPDETHVTTCYDMALIGSEAIRNPLFRQVVGTCTYVIPPTNKHPEENTYLSNHHKMLQPNGTYTYEYCIGGKTGYTVAARNTLITFAERDGLLLVCVVMNEEKPNHYLDTRILLDYCFENFKLCSIEEGEEETSREFPGKELLQNQESVAIAEEENAAVVLPKTADFADTQVTMTSQEKEEGSLCRLQYTYGGKQIGSTEVIFAGEDRSYFENASEASREEQKEQEEQKKDARDEKEKRDFDKKDAVISCLILAAAAGIYIMNKKNNK